MLATMLRRGPDDTGMFAQPEICMLHTRLAVMDPARGAQPMETFWEDEQYVICYNGELYNTLEIRNELNREGHQFFTDTDTEVVLHAYAQWKEAALQRMNGIFAFAVWEKNHRRLFLARDRMGVKPLFYREHKGGILFASEMKTILSYPGVSAALDADGVTVTATVTNTGKYDGAETMQVYVKVNQENTPNAQLKGIKKITLAAGESKTVSVKLPVESFALFDEEGILRLTEGDATIYVGGHGPDARSTALTGTKAEEFKIQITENKVLA
jgi:asparagine synthase (glutamine-hydrolysing)